MTQKTADPKIVAGILRVQIGVNLEKLGKKGAERETVDWTARLITKMEKLGYGTEAGEMRAKLLPYQTAPSAFRTSACLNDGPSAEVKNTYPEIISACLND